MVIEHDPPILPAHIEETVQAIARLQAQHENEATRLERLMDSLTGAIGTPVFLFWLCLVAVLWTVGNLACVRLGYAALDPPPFAWMQGAVSLSALCVTVIILTSQRRADKLAGLRAQLTLELSILAEQKTAKVIELLEENRRDNPMLRDRVDAQADEMSEPADPEAVLEALSNPATATAEAEEPGVPAA